MVKFGRDLNSIKKNRKIKKFEMTLVGTTLLHLSNLDILPKITINYTLCALQICVKFKEANLALNEY